MGMAATTKWTAGMVRALPADGNRYEVIDGELFVTPAPSWDHQEAAFELATRLRSYLQAIGVGNAERVGAGVPPALYGRDGRTYSLPHHSPLKAHSSTPPSPSSRAPRVDGAPRPLRPAEEPDR